MRQGRIEIWAVDVGLHIRTLVARGKLSLENTTMSRLNNATVLIVDAGPRSKGLLSDDDDDTKKTILDASKRAIREFVQYHMMFRAKDEVAVIACGSNVTDNPLNAEIGNGKFEGIQVIGKVGLDLARPSLLEDVQNMTSSDREADPMECLVLAASLMEERRKAGKRFRCRVIFVTDGKADCSIRKGDIDAYILNAIGGLPTSLCTRIDVVGVGESFRTIPLASARLALQRRVDPKQYVFVKTERGGVKDEDNCENGNEDVRVVTKSAPLISVLADISGGTTTPAAESTAEIVAGCVPLINGTTTVFRGELKIGSFVNINVHAFNKTSEVNLPTLKKESCHAESEDPDEDRKKKSFGKVKMDREHRSSVSSQEVPPEKRRNGYRYGADVVVLDESDKNALTFESDKCLDVLGFVDGTQVPRHHYLSKSVAICPAPGDARSAHKLSALREALRETGKRAIVRFVKRTNTQPFLGCLEAGPSYLIFNQLPFVEDIRDYDFGTLNDEEDERFKVSSSQLRAVDELIDALPMSESSLPMNCTNPVLSRFYRSLHARAIDSNHRFDDQPDATESFPIEPRKSTFESMRAIKALGHVEKEFAVSRRPPELSKKDKKRKRRNFWGDRDVLGASEKNGDVKAVSLAGDRLDDSKHIKTDDVSDLFGSNASSTKQHVGSINPVDDFNAMVMSANGGSKIDHRALQRAESQMKNQILTLAVKGPLFVEKATSCVEAFRRAAVRSFVSVYEFNQLLRYIKSDASLHALWTSLVNRSMSLVTDQENSTSSVTRTEASSFVQSDSAVQAGTAIEDDDDGAEDEDLFSAME